MARSKNTLRGVLRQWRFTPFLGEIKVQLNSDMEVWGKWVEAAGQIQLRRPPAAGGDRLPRTPTWTRTLKCSDTAGMSRPSPERNEFTAHDFVNFWIKLGDVRNVHVAAPQSAGRAGFFGGARSLMEKSPAHSAHHKGFLQQMHVLQVVR